MRIAANIPPAVISTRQPPIPGNRSARTPSSDPTASSIGSNSAKAEGAASENAEASSESNARDVYSEVAGQIIGQLEPEEQRQVESLKARDREVRAHEQAHVAAAGPYVQSGPHYEYETGPDGRRYAVAGHVNIDTAPVPGDPEATIQKAQVIRAAALAPAEPSAQDQKVAAQATKMETQARLELREADQNPEAETTGGLASEASSESAKHRPFPRPPFSAGGESTFSEDTAVTGLLLNLLA